MADTSVNGKPTPSNGKAHFKPTPRTDAKAKQPAPGNTGEEQKGKATQAEQLLELAGAADFIHTPDSKAFALVKIGDGNNRHVETLSIRTKGFRNWLSREYYRATGKAASTKAMQDALGVLESRACYDGAEREVCCRIGAAGDSIWIDLADPDWRTVRVDRDGWRIVRAGALFRRPRGLLALPAPAPNGNLDELRQFVNVSDDDWPLVVAWELQALRQRGPYPLLELHGEQGTAKSTTARVLRSTIDPNAAPLRSQPRDERDLVIAASNSWVIALDNLSYVPPWLSDALCRLSTGGGFGTRELYSDDEEIIFDAQRPIILTGIEDLATRGDLLDRALLIRLPRIEEDARQPEALFWRRFEAARPRIIGALLDALSGALRELPHVQIPRLPRMADFALLGVAAERALGWPDGSFLAAYTRNRDDATVATLESALIFPTLEQFINELPDGKWSGSCQALLTKLNVIVDDKARLRYWPTTPRALSGHLRRLAPTLRAIGIEIQFDQSDGSGSKRVVRIVAVERENLCNPPSQPTQPTQRFGDGSDGSDGSPHTYSPSPADDVEVF